MPVLRNRTNNLWQVLVWVRHAILKVIGEEDRSLLLPNVGLSALDVLRHITLALPVVDIEIFALGYRDRVRQGTPNKVAQSWSSRSCVDNGNTLSNLNGTQARRPKVCHAEDEVCSSKVFNESIPTTVQISLLHIDALSSESLRCRPGQIASESSDLIGF